MYQCWLINQSANWAISQATYRSDRYWTLARCKIARLLENVPCHFMYTIFHKICSQFCFTLFCWICFMYLPIRFTVASVTLRFSWCQWSNCEEIWVHLNAIIRTKLSLTCAYFCVYALFGWIVTGNPYHCVPYAPRMPFSKCLVWALSLQCHMNAMASQIGSSSSVFNISG